MVHDEVSFIRLNPFDLTPFPGAKQSGPAGKVPATVLFAITVLDIETMAGKSIKSPPPTVGDCPWPEPPTQWLSVMVSLLSTIVPDEMCIPHPVALPLLPAVSLPLMVVLVMNTCGAPLMRMPWSRLLLMLDESMMRLFPTKLMAPSGRVLEGRSPPVISQFSNFKVPTLPLPF